jgi:hypothetical protein
MRYYALLVYVYLHSVLPCVTMCVCVPPHALLRVTSVLHALLRDNSVQ